MNEERNLIEVPQNYNELPVEAQVARDNILKSYTADYIEANNQELAMTDAEKKLRNLKLSSENAMENALTEEEAEIAGQVLQERWLQTYFPQIPVLNSFLSNAISPTREPLKGRALLARMDELIHDPSALNTDDDREILDTMRTGDDSALYDLGIKLNRIEPWQEPEVKPQTQSMIEAVGDQPIEIDPNTGMVSTMGAQNASPFDADVLAENARQRSNYINEQVNALKQETYKRNFLSLWASVAPTMTPLENELVRRMAERGQYGLVGTDGLLDFFNIPGKVHTEFGSAYEILEASNRGDINALRAFRDDELYYTYQHKVAKWDKGSQARMTLMLNAARGNIIEQTSIFADMGNAALRGTDRLLRGPGEAVVGTAASAIEGIGTLQEWNWNKPRNENAWYRMLSKEMSDNAQFDATIGASVAHMGVSEQGFWAKAFTGLAEQVPIWLTLSMGSSPLYKTAPISQGSSYLAMSYAGDTQRELLAGGAPMAIASTLGWLSGGLQSAIETVQFKTLTRESDIAAGQLRKALSEGKRAYFNHIAKSIGKNTLTDIPVDTLKEMSEEGSQAAVNAIIVTLGLEGDPALALKEGMSAFKEDFLGTGGSMFLSVAGGRALRGARTIHAESKLADAQVQADIIRGGLFGQAQSQAPLSEKAQLMASDGSVTEGIRQEWNQQGSDAERLEFLKNRTGLLDAEAEYLHRFFIAKETIESRHKKTLQKAKIEYFIFGNDRYKDLASLPMGFDSKIENTIDGITHALKFAGFKDVAVTETAEGSGEYVVTLNSSKKGAGVSFLVREGAKMDGSYSAATGVWERLVLQGVEGNRTQAYATLAQFGDAKKVAQAIYDSLLNAKANDNDKKAFAETYGTREDFTERFAVDETFRAGVLVDNSASLSLQWQMNGGEWAKSLMDQARESFVSRWQKDEAWRNEMISTYGLTSRGLHIDENSKIQIQMEDGTSSEISVDGIIELAYGDARHSTVAHETLHGIVAVMRKVVNESPNQESEVVKLAKSALATLENFQNTIAKRTKRVLNIQEGDTLDHEFLAEVMERFSATGYEEVSKEEGKVLRRQYSDSVFSLRRLARAFLDWFFATNDSTFVDIEGEAYQSTPQGDLQDSMDMLNLYAMRGLETHFNDLYEEMKNADLAQQADATLASARKGGNVNRKAAKTVRENLQRELKTLKEGEQTDATQARQQLLEQAIADYEEVERIGLERAAVAINKPDAEIDNLSDVETIREYNEMMIEREYEKAMAVATTDEAKDEAKAKRKTAMAELTARVDNLRKQVSRRDNVEEVTDTRYSISAEQDLAYKRAIEEGDLDLARQMVREAAAKAMPNTKVVDEDGLPLVVYHGSYKHGFTVFKAKDRGIFTSTSKENADGYSLKHGGTYALFANAKNPLVVDAEGSKWSRMKFKGIDKFKKALNIRMITPVDLAVYAREHGYDGVVIKNVLDGDVMGDDVIVYHSNQIKSAEVATYDDNGNLIPLSERFNEESNDIRYSISVVNPMTDADWDKAIAHLNDETFKKNTSTYHTWLSRIVYQRDEDVMAEVFVDEVVKQNTSKSIKRRYTTNVNKMNKSRWDIEKRLYDYRVRSAQNDMEQWDEVLRFLTQHFDGRYVDTSTIPGNSVGTKIVNAGRVSLNTIREMFNRYNKNPEVAALFNKVTPALEAIRAIAGFGGGFKSHVYGEYGLSRVAYNRAAFNRKDTSDQTRATTLLHELIHALTHPIASWEKTNKSLYRERISVNDIDYENDIEPLNRELNNLYKHALKSGLDPKKYYGMSEVFEFLPELADTNFREKLKNITTNDDPRNLLERAEALLDQYLQVIPKFADALEAFSPRLEFNLKPSDYKPFDYMDKEAHGQVGDYRFSIVLGEAGAQKLEDNLALLDNLTVAKQMLSDRAWTDLSIEDRRKIKLATGWEMGIDGKWRLERLEGEVDLGQFFRKPTRTIDDVNEERDAIEAKYKPLIDKAIEENNLDEASRLNDEAMEAYAKIEGVDKVAESLPLDQVLKNDELYQAYPELKDITVEVGIPSRSTIRGSYYSDDKVILISHVGIPTGPLSEENAKTLKRVLIHETQHAIQHIEGFAIGGNMEQFQSGPMFPFSKKQRDLFFAIADMLVLPVPSSINADTDMVVEAIQHEQRVASNKENRWSGNSQKKLDTIEKLCKDAGYSSMDEAIEDIRKHDEFRTPYGQYRRLAGEVEARNASDRSVEEMKRLLEETEDIEREYQIVRGVVANAVSKIEAYNQNATRYSIVSDPALTKKYEDEIARGEYYTTYRAMELVTIDGKPKLVPPMAGIVDGKYNDPMDEGDWVKADIRPDLINENGKIVISYDVVNQKTGKRKRQKTEVAFNPYIHSSFNPFNDQFKAAHNRPNMVVVEMHIPFSAATGPKTHMLAKDAPGFTKWNAGSVAKQLQYLGKPQRMVLLSNYGKVNRILSMKEVADKMDEMSQGIKDMLVIPQEVMPPSLREEMEARGYHIGTYEEATKRAREHKELQAGYEYLNKVFELAPLFAVYAEDVDVASSATRFSVMSAGLNKGWGDLSRTVPVVGDGTSTWKYKKGKKSKEAKRELLTIALNNIRKLDNVTNVTDTEAVIKLDGVNFLITERGLFHGAGRRLQKLGSVIARIGEVLNASVEIPRIEEPWHYRIAKVNFYRPEFVLITAKEKIRGGEEEIVSIQSLYSLNVKSDAQLAQINGTATSPFDDTSIAQLKAAWEELFKKNLEDHIAKAHSAQNVNQKLSSADIAYAQGLTDAPLNVGDPSIVETDSNGTARFSIATYENGGRDVLVNYLKGQVQKKSLTQKDADSILDELDKVYEICKRFAEDPELKSFGLWSAAVVETDNEGKPIFGVVRPNGDYAYNIDFSTVCKKRRPLNRVFAELVTRGIVTDENIGEVLAEDRIPVLQEIIKDHGLEVACALCFVDSKRYKIGEVAKKYSNMHNGILEMYNNNKSEFKKAHQHYLDRKNKKYKEFDKKKNAWKTPLPRFYDKLVNLIATDPSARIPVDAGDLISSEGLDNFVKQHPSIFDLYRSFGGVSKAKDAFDDVPYNNDIIRPFAHATNYKTPFSPRSLRSTKKVFHAGGVRVQSFSDFVPVMVFDYMQMFAEMAARGLPTHIYTKEQTFVKIFGNIGAKINMSLVPTGMGVARNKDGSIYHDKNGNTVEVVANGLMRDKDGNVLYDAEGRPMYDVVDETFPMEEAFRLRLLYGDKGNVGTIFVGVSDEHIWAMLDDDRIDQIIPYHKSSLNGVVAALRMIDSYLDYTRYQTTKDPTKMKDASESEEGGEEDSEKDANKGKIKKDFNFYADLEKTNDPRKTASNYLAWCKERGYIPKFEKFSTHRNYYKLLADFRLYDNDGNYAPQTAVNAQYHEGVTQDIKEALLEHEEAQDALARETNAIINKFVAETKRLEAEKNANEKKKKVKRSIGVAHQVSMRDLKSYDLGTIQTYSMLDDLIENRARVEGRDISANEVKELYNNLNIQLDPFSAKRIADRTNAKVAGNDLPNNALEEDALNRIITQLNPQATGLNLGGKALRMARAQGVDEGARAVQRIMQERNMIERIQREEYESAKGMRTPEFENEMGFSITRTIMALNDAYGRATDEERLAIDQLRSKRKAQLEERIDQELDAEDPLETFAEDEMSTADYKRYLELREALQEAGRKTRDALEAREEKKKQKRQQALLERDDEGGFSLDDISDEELENDMQEEQDIMLSNFKSILDLNDPNEIVWFVQQFSAWKRLGKTDATLAELKELSRDPIFVRDFAMTLANIAETLSNGMVYSRNREQIKDRINDITTAKSLTSVRTRAIGVFIRIHEARIKENRKEIVKGLRKFLKKKIVDGKQALKVAKRDIDRKVTAEVEEEARMIRSVLAMGSMAVRRAMVEVETTINGFSDKLQQEKETYRDYRKAQKLRHILNVYGGAKHMAASQLQKLAQDTETYFNQELEKQAEKRIAKEEATKVVNDALVKALMSGREGELEPGEHSSIFTKLSNALDSGIGLFDVTMRIIAEQVKDPALRARAQEQLQVIANHVHEAEITARARNLQYQKRIEEISRKHYKSGYNLAQRHRQVISEELSKRISQRYTENEEGKKDEKSITQRNRLTVGQVLQLKMSMSQEDYTDNAMRWHRDKDCLDAINSVLTAQDLAWAEDIQAFLNETFVEARDVYKSITGYTVGTTPNYWPVKIRRSESGVKGTVRLYSDVTNILTPRVPHALDFDESWSAFQAVNDKLEQQAHMIGFANHDQIIMDTLCNGEVRRAIRLALGKKFDSKLQEKLQDILMGPQVKKEFLAKAFSKFSGYFSMCSLGFNAMSVLRQTAGWPAVANEIGWRGTGKALVRMIFDFSAESRAKWDFLCQHDAYNARYQSGFSPEIEEALRGNASKVGATIRKVMFNAGMAALRWMDKLLARGVCLYTFDVKVKKYIDQGLSTQDAWNRAALEAWSVIETSQQSSLTSNQYNSINQSAWARLFHSMRSGPLQVLQYGQHNIARILRGDPEGLKQFLKYSCGGMVLSTILNEMVNQLTAWLRDDDDELFDEEHIDRTLARVIPGLVFGNLMAAPILGDAVELAAAKITGTWHDGTIGDIPALSFVTRTAMEVGEATATTFSDDNDTLAREWFEVAKTLFAPLRLADQIHEGQTGEGILED